MSSYLRYFSTTSHFCREMDGTSYAEEVLVTKSELEEKKQRMSELETQASEKLLPLCRSVYRHGRYQYQSYCEGIVTKAEAPESSNGQVSSPSHSTAQHDAAQRSAAWHSIARHGMAWHSTAELSFPAVHVGVGIVSYAWMACR